MDSFNLKVIGIKISDREHIELLNQILSEFGEFIIGRFGMQYFKKKVHIITIIIDAPKESIDELIEKINMIECISVIDSTEK